MQIEFNSNHIKMAGCLIGGLVIGYISGSYYTKKEIENSLAQNFLGNFFQEGQKFGEEMEKNSKEISKAHDQINRNFDLMKNDFEKRRQEFRDEMNKPIKSRE